MKPPIHALLRCIIAAEMLSIYEEMIAGESENSQTLWDAAGKARAFIDQPRVADHRTLTEARIRTLREEMRMVQRA